MLLAQCIQLAVAGLLEFTVTLALFRQLQLQRPDRRARVDTVGEPVPGSRYLTLQYARPAGGAHMAYFGVGEQNPLFKGILPAAVVILASLLTRLRRH